MTSWQKRQVYELLEINFSFLWLQKKRQEEENNVQRTIVGTGRGLRSQDGELHGQNEDEAVQGIKFVLNFLYVHIFSPGETPQEKTLPFQWPPPLGFHVGNQPHREGMSTDHQLQSQLSFQPRN